ncbi:uncharacterized protein EHS24_006426 [Apiotrichum porosum]|uniref:Uncharacterized protein n=1 Tax=Apiotrichum porosum TaxID=105984 RepID=A0A427Y190_9TREE|nr:uncharacterized protein EHS24_006426 [Apiotrichum porosum]RSH84888.1 hypothetical protein EHS24_006426 [Apiotrichum porosum]
MGPEEGLPQWRFPTDQAPSPTITASRASLALSLSLDPPRLSLPRLSSPIFSHDFLFETWGMGTPEQEHEQEGEGEQETEAPLPAVSILRNPWQPPRSSPAELPTQPQRPAHSAQLRSTPPNRPCAIGAVLNHLTAAVKSRQLRERIARLTRARARGSAPPPTPTPPPRAPQAPHTEAPPPDYATDVAHGELLLQIEDMVVVAPPVYARREDPPAYPVREEPAPRARVHSSPQAGVGGQHASTTTTSERMFQTATAAGGVHQSATPDMHQWLQERYPGVAQRWRECTGPYTIGRWLHDTHPVVARHWAEHEAIALRINAEAVGMAAFGRAPVPPLCASCSQSPLPGPSRLAACA